MKRELLNRSLHRLGECSRYEHRMIPDVFIENELAIAVRRFGLWRVIRRIIEQEWFWLTRMAGIL